MIRVDPANGVTDYQPTRAATAPVLTDRSLAPGSGEAIPRAEIERLLQTISQALALGAGNAERAGYRLLRDGRERVELLEPTQHPWAPTLAEHWRRIQQEYLARHPGADYPE